MEWDAGPKWLIDLTRRAALALVVVGFCGFLVDGVSRAPRPSLLPPAGRVTDAGLQAFGAALLNVEPGPGLTRPARPACALVARSAGQLAQGLQGQPSLHHFAGMVFVYRRPTTAVLSDRHVELALTVAWFDRTGRYIAAQNTEPCPTGDGCRSYAAGRPYLYALEVPAGGLKALGIGPGSSVQLGGPCSG